MAIYLNGHRYSCNLGSNPKLIMVNLIASEKPEVDYIVATAIDGSVLKTVNGLYLTLNKEG